MINPARDENFSQEGVLIEIPGLKQKIRVKKTGGKKLEDFPGKATDIFRPKRLVIVFDLLDDDMPTAQSGELSQPVTLRVRYTAQDAPDAGGWEKPRLGYYKNGTWKPFSKTADKFSLEPDKGDPAQGYGVVQLKRWGDPAMGWEN